MIEYDVTYLWNTSQTRCVVYTENITTHGLCYWIRSLKISTREFVGSVFSSTSVRR